MEGLCRNGITLRFREEGEGAPPVVFLHGWGCSHRHFAPQLEHFARRHRVLAPDQRGHGESDAPHEPVSIDDLADDLVWLLGQRGVERPVLVGHSLGGAVILAAARRSPGLARGLVLVDPAVMFHAKARPVQERLVERMTLHTWREAVREFAERGFFLPADTSERRREIVDGLTKTPRRVLHTAFRDLLAFDAEAALAAVDVPVLLVDPPRPTGDRSLLRAACPALEEVEVPNVGHFLQLEDPAAVNAALDAFVARCA